MYLEYTWHFDTFHIVLQGNWRLKSCFLLAMQAVSYVFWRKLWLENGRLLTNASADKLVGLDSLPLPENALSK